MAYEQSWIISKRKRKKDSAFLKISSEIRGNISSWKEHKV